MTTTTPKPKLDRFSRDLGDGRFLIRPFGGLGSVYEVNEDGKEAFLRYRRFAGLPYLVIFLITALIGVDPVIVLFIMFAWLVFDLSKRSSYGKRGVRVDRHLWEPLKNPDTGPLFPRWAYLFFVPILLSLEWASLSSIYQLHKSGRAVPYESWAFVALWIFFLWLCWRDLRKKPVKAVAPAFPKDEEAPVQPFTAPSAETLSSVADKEIAPAQPYIPQSAAAAAVNPEEKDSGNSAPPKPSAG